MTVVAAMVSAGDKFMNQVYLACDSRVVFRSEISLRETLYTDKAQKIIILNDSLVIAYAGDFYRANLAIEAVIPKVKGIYTIL
ncbi:Ntn hydrolase family protein [Paenibacillus cymbidii]|uniref:hypothetical protein n=1 Tax=Paenibacillus cymbidii TaxID=1639034 RepID=UPI0010819C98|nr:hypothetical protein [Paenibacillus cymbidii]